MSNSKKITADLVIDFYLKAKKLSGVKKEEMMKKVIHLSKHLNERMDLEKIGFE